MPKRKSQEDLETKNKRQRLITKVAEFTENDWTLIKQLSPQFKSQIQEATFNPRIVLRSWTDRRHYVFNHFFPQHLWTKLKSIANEHLSRSFLSEKTPYYAKMVKYEEELMRFYGIKVNN